MNKTMQVIGVLLALVRHYVSDEVINVIKAAALEAITHGEWSQGEKTQFVMDRARMVVQKTPTPFDDFTLEIAAFLYTRKFAAKLTAAVKEDKAAAAVVKMQPAREPGSAL